MFERHLIKARIDDGRKRAKARGVQFGRPCKLDPHYVRPRRGAMNPHTARTMIAPTIAPMKPAFWPALYHPTAWPRYVATKAPTIPSTAVKIYPVGSYLFPG